MQPSIMNNAALRRSLISLFLLCLPATAAVAAVTVVSNGPGRYIVQGAGLNGVAGVQVAIQYDPTSLGSPRVAQSGLFYGAASVNSAGTGTLTFTAINPYPRTSSGSGEIAEIVFDQVGAAPAVPKVASLGMLDVNGVIIKDQDGSPTTSTTITTTTNSGNSGNSGGTPAENGSTGGGGAPFTGTGFAGTPGTIALPADGGTLEAKVQQDPAPVAAEQTAAAKAAEPAAEPAAQAAKESGAAAACPPAGNGAVLESFCSYRGDRSRLALLELFAKASRDASQQPAVVISDGTARASVFFRLAAGKSAPNFYVEGGSLVSLKKKDDGWLAEIVPERGVSSTSLMVLAGGTATRKVVSLTVAPPLPASFKPGSAGRLTAADFERFLKERGTDKAPLHDLNGDGKRDYLDDFIFTANYLANSDPGTAAAAPRASAGK